MAAAAIPRMPEALARKAAASGSTVFPWGLQITMYIVFPSRRTAAGEQRSETIFKAMGRVIIPIGLYVPIHMPDDNLT
jgi:hypothetical protein